MLNSEFVAKTLVVVVLLGIVGVGKATSVAAQEGSPTVSTDSPSYAVGDTATVVVSGILECAGTEVDVGFFGDDRQPLLTTAAEVNGEGAVTGVVRLSLGTRAYAGAIGDCIAGGAVLASEPTSILFVDAPKTGTGTESFSSNNASAWAAVLAGAGLVAAGAGAFAVAVRRRRG